MRQTSYPPVNLSNPALPPRRPRLQAELELQRLGPAGELLVRVWVCRRHVVGTVAELCQDSHERERAGAGPAEAEDLHGELALERRVDEGDFARVRRGAAGKGAEGGDDEDVVAPDGRAFGRHAAGRLDGEIC